MKLLPWIMALALLPVSVYANDKTYRWILEQYEAGNEDVIDNQAVGLIEGEPYLSLIAKDTAGAGLFLAVFKQSNKNNLGVALAYLPNIGIKPYSVEITKNSIFLTSGYCHHGCYDTRYQFKNVGQQFKLVGIESQSEMLCGYYDEKNAPADCTNSVRSGNSHNLLSSTTICWFEIEPESNLPSKPPKPYQPRGVQHEIRFSKIDLPLLDGFDLENSSLPIKSCYFDYKKRLHVN